MYQKLKGTYDLFQKDLKIRDIIIRKFKKQLKLFGYDMIETPIIENANVFIKENDTSDMVTKEMYAFSLNNKDKICLRPEGTAGVIRSFVENKMYALELPVKLAYNGPMFRHERPQKGRQRQFNQLGIENIGIKSALVDSEVIALAYRFLESLQIKGIKVLINSLGDNTSRINYSNALKDYFNNYSNNLCGDCVKRLEKNPLRILDCKVDKDKDFIKNTPKLSDYLTKDSLDYYGEVKSYLDALNIPYIEDEKLVRGLDYYTDTVFEIVSIHEDAGSQNTILAGGRYDNLVSEFNGPSLSGIGFASGLERLQIICESEGLIKVEEKETDFYIITMTNSSYGLKVADLLRNNSYSVELNAILRSMKSQFKSSERAKAKNIIIIGEDEINNNVVIIKNVAKQTQEVVSINKIIDFIKENKYV